VTACEAVSSSSEVAVNTPCVPLWGTSTHCAAEPVASIVIAAGEPPFQASQLRWVRAELALMFSLRREMNWKLIWEVLPRRCSSCLKVLSD
jgi:hypothetical protein